MNSKFKITIPKPCHEDWNIMSSVEKGRFCNSCSKTVVNFTKKSTKEIKDYLVKNRNNRVCGHFYKKQLDTITIEIPKVTFNQQLTFQKAFVLALFFVMGTTLFSCQYSDGKKQKIQDIIIVDTIKKIKENIDLLIVPIKKDSIVINKKKLVPSPPSTQGIIFCESKTDSILNLKTSGEVTIDGDIDFIEIEEEEIIMGLIIEEPPKFKVYKYRNEQTIKMNFEKRVEKIIKENINRKTTQNLDLPEGRYKVYTQFIIDTLGKVTDIKVRAPHTKLEDKIIKVFNKLPQFIPGKQDNKVVKTKYNLPITFNIE
jgi:hypothetical protein